MADLSTLNAPALTALAAVVAKAAKAKRGELTADSTYVLDETVTLHIVGELPVGKDENYVPTVAIPLKVTLALFARYAGVTGSAALDALEKAMTEALTINALTGKAKKAAVDAISELADLDAAEAKVMATLAALPEKTRLGKVLSKDVTVTVVAAK